MKYIFQPLSSLSTYVPIYICCQIASVLLVIIVDSKNYRKGNHLQVFEKFSFPRRSSLENREYHTDTFQNVDWQEMRTEHRTGMIEGRRAQISHAHHISRESVNRLKKDVYQRFSREREWKRQRPFTSPVSERNTTSSVSSVITYSLGSRYCEDEGACTASKNQ